MLVDNYAHEYILLNSTINDTFNLDKYKYLKNILPNYYSYQHRIYNQNLANKYLELIKKKKN